MEEPVLVHTGMLQIAGETCQVEVFSRPDGSHFARTELAPMDGIFNVGVSLEDALLRHEALLPLAIGLRQLRMKRCSS